MIGCEQGDCDDDLLDKALSWTSMKGNFLSVLVCWVVIIIDKLITIFLHASCSSTSTCPGADYSKEKGQIRKNKKVATIL